MFVLETNHDSQPLRGYPSSQYCINHWIRKQPCGEEYGSPCWVGCTTAASRPEGCTRQVWLFPNPKSAQIRSFSRHLWFWGYSIFWNPVCLDLHIIKWVVLEALNAWNLEPFLCFYAREGCQWPQCESCNWIHRLIDTSWSDAFVNWEHER